MSCTQADEAIQATRVPYDLLHLIAASVMEERSFRLSDLQSLALASKYMLETVSASLYESLRFRSLLEAEMFQEKSRDLAAYTKALTVEFQSRTSNWHELYISPRSLWRVIGHDFVNLQHLTLTPDAIDCNRACDLDPPRFNLDPVLSPKRSMAFLPCLKTLTIPFSQIEVLRLLSPTSPLKEVTLLIADHREINRHNKRARQLEQAEHLSNINAASHWNFNERLYFSIPPCMNVTRLNIQAKIALPLEDTLEFAARLFPRFEVLSGCGDGAPGHVKRISQQLLRRIHAMPYLQELSLIYAPLTDQHSNPPHCLDFQRIWGVEETLITYTNLTPGGPGYDSQMVSVVPSEPLISATMNPLVSALYHENPSLRLIRHVYDDHPIWNRDQRKRWEFQAEIRKPVKKDVREEGPIEGSEDINQVEGLIDDGIEEAEDTDEAIWELRVIALPAIG